MAKMSGYDAIEYAEANGLTLNMYNSPIEPARIGLTIKEAKEIASDDDGLIYLNVFDADNAYEHITNGISEAQQDEWLEPERAQDACDVYLLDPALNDGDAFVGSSEDAAELVKKVRAFMAQRAGVELVADGEAFIVSNYGGDGGPLASEDVHEETFVTLEDARAEVRRRLGDCDDWRRTDGCCEGEGRNAVEAYDESRAYGCGGVAIDKVSG